MPFPPHIRRPYSWPQINRMLPRQRGVYGIYNEDEWLYVGHSDDIRSGLIDQWETNHRLNALRPTGWTYELTHAPTMRAVLLIAELRPVLNVRTRARMMPLRSTA